MLTTSPLNRSPVLVPGVEFWDPFKKVQVRREGKEKTCRCPCLPVRTELRVCLPGFRVTPPEVPDSVELEEN